MKKKDIEKLDEICIDVDLQKIRLKRMKRKKQIEKVLTVFIGLFIANCVLLYANSKLTSKSQKKCIEMGYSENYCYERL